MRTLWLGGAGTTTAYGVARCVRAHWGDAVRIVGADMKPAHVIASSELADAHVVVPAVADEPAFTDALVRGLREHGADTYVPLLIEEVALAAALRDAGALPDGVAVLAPSAAVAALCADKLACARRLEELGVPVPPTARIDATPWFAEGVVVKPRLGQGSRGVAHVESPDDLAAVRANGDGLVAQRRCAPPEVTVDCFHSAHDGRVVAVPRERVEVKAGVCTKARLFHDPGLEAVARRLSEGLELTGVFCFQAMRGPEGWEVTDLNPRCGAATPMSAAVGVDVTAAALAELWGQDPGRYLGDFSGEPFVVRHFVETVRAAA